MRGGVFLSILIIILAAAMVGLGISGRSKKFMEALK